MDENGSAWILLRRKMGEEKMDRRGSLGEEKGYPNFYLNCIKEFRLKDTLLFVKVGGPTEMLTKKL